MKSEQRHGGVGKAREGQARQSNGTLGSSQPGKGGVGKTRQGSGKARERGGKARKG